MALFSRLLLAGALATARRSSACMIALSANQYPLASLREERPETVRPKSHVPTVATAAAVHYGDASMTIWETEWDKPPAN
ncbi:hypothetical protein PRIPAC_82550 [Pristionchus pacificus]|uniref:Uncharacterized protein n=1 Tax=Pristionchus pacificus TaxID=54126 RepID=A0A2A6BXH5_PRIPA|nr:hypothetical protein PRIPAC_82550 [Pristionchus pacificus]|eukprot:PDM70589.1 hypothetical protein PRIPAC_46835 [Pristionchus pacificus]